MIRLGVCTSPDNIDLIADAGFDYIEIGFAWLNGLSEEEYQQALAKVKASRIKVEASNGMLPGTLKVVGPDVDENAIRAYFEKTFARGQEIGVKTVVFGSGAARAVPEGFPQDEAWRQIYRYLTIAAEYCDKYDIDLAIEPLRRVECNIMNLVTEGTLMSALVNHPRIGVLGDTHHMLCGCEPWSAFEQAGKLLKHVHISHSMGNENGRDYPAPGDDGNYKEIFDVLKACGYDGCVSIEAGVKDLAEDAPKAYKALSEALNA